MKTNDVVTVAVYEAYDYFQGMLASQRSGQIDDGIIRVAVKEKLRLAFLAVDEKVAAPIVHMNGTSKASLLQERNDAFDALSAAYDLLKRAAPNSRDAYPETGLMPKLEAQHRARLQAIHNVMKSLETEIWEIDTQGDSRS